MNFKIGFSADTNNIKKEENVSATTVATVEPKKSLVQVLFASRGRSYTYYNDAFDLHPGDIVYVEGALEGIQGRVVEVSYTFKIKLSDYKRVIAKADTNITGTFYMADSHFVAFDREVIPFEKIITWYKAPEKPDEEFVSSNGDEKFSLDNLGGMNIRSDIAQRGKDYYIDNNVVYISIDGTQGRAIVEGSKPYEVEFTYQNGQVSNLVCSCFCSYTCKHQFASMLQLKDILKKIEENYQEQYNRSNYFAAILNTDLFNFAINTNKCGSFTLR